MSSLFSKINICHGVYIFLYSQASRNVAFCGVYYCGQSCLKRVIQAKVGKLQFVELLTYVKMVSFLPMLLQINISI